MFTTCPISHKHANSSSQPIHWVGNLDRCRRKIISNFMESGHSTPQLGNLNQQRSNLLPDPMGWNQSTSPVGNLNGRRCDIVLGDRVSRLGIQQSESGSSNTVESLGRILSPPLISRRLLGSAAKRLWSSTIQTTAYTEPEMQPDGQGNMKHVHLSDDSTNEYQISYLADETELETAPNVENLSSVDKRTSIRSGRP